MQQTLNVAKDVRPNNTTLTLNGTDYNLCYDLNAFAELEDRFGSVEKALLAMEKGSFKAIRAFVWAGLIRDTASITEREVGSMITTNDLEAAAECIGNAIAMTAPKQTANHPAAKRGNARRK